MSGEGRSSQSHIEHIWLARSGKMRFCLWFWFWLFCEVGTQNVDDTQNLLRDINRVVKIWEESPTGYRTPHFFADDASQWASLTPPTPAPSGQLDGSVRYEMAACVFDRAFGAVLTGHAVRAPRQGDQVDLRDNGMPIILLENMLFDLPACCITPHHTIHNSVCLDIIRSGYAVLLSAWEQLATFENEVKGSQELDRVIDELVSMKAFKTLARAAAALAFSSGQEPGEKAAALFAIAERCADATQCAAAIENVTGWLSHEGHKRTRARATRAKTHTDL